MRGGIITTDGWLKDTVVRYRDTHFFLENGDMLQVLGKFSQSKAHPPVIMLGSRKHLLNQDALSATKLLPPLNCIIPYGDMILAQWDDSNALVPLSMDTAKQLVEGKMAGIWKEWSQMEDPVHVEMDSLPCSVLGKEGESAEEDQEEEEGSDSDSYEEGYTSSISDSDSEDSSSSDECESESEEDCEGTDDDEVDIEDDEID